MALDKLSEGGGGKSRKEQQCHLINYQKGEGERTAVPLDKSSEGGGGKSRKEQQWHLINYHRHVGLGVG